MLDWHGCYREGWQNEIVPEAFSHPAKFARGLIRRIYEHALAQGYLKEGDTVLDPFGGVALGALDAMYNGLHYVGVELEEKFVALGQQNIDLWNSRYSALPRWGTAVILQGDSRQLYRVLDGARAQGVIGSPPYASQVVGHGQERISDKTRRYDGFISSSGERLTPGRARGIKTMVEGYKSTNPANLGNLREGDFAQAIVSSPPWHSSLNDGLTENDRQKYKELTRCGQGVGTNYGQSPGQLAAMREGDVDAVISSPPYAESLSNPSDEIERTGQGGPIHPRHYSPNPSNLGNTRGDTFWTAARQIVAQCYQVLVPGGVAIWVVKSFVRNKQIVDFPGQWRQLCESCGFETIEQIRAWLIEDRGTQIALTGDHVTRTVERKSFFRRLAERKGSPRIDYEVVLVTGKQVNSDQRVEEIPP